MENFAPLETITCEGEYSSPLSQRSFSQIARRSPSVPAAEVVLGQPHIQRLMRGQCGLYCGVTKSGSPTLKETTSRPLWRISLALASIASVGDGAIAAHKRESSKDKTNAPLTRSGNRLPVRNEFLNHYTSISFILQPYFGLNSAKFSVYFAHFDFDSCKFVFPVSLLFHCMPPRSVPSLSICPPASAVMPGAVC
ncbi:MAG: hypothetical protein ACLR4A_00140 [Christensenellales bacterium]